MSRETFNVSPVRVETPHFEESLRNSDIFSMKVFEPDMVLNGDRRILDDAHRLRGVVYTQEMSFLPEEVLDDEGREIDQYDAQSLHFVVQDREQNTAGTARLIINSEANPIPISSLFPEVYVEPNSAEASRLVVEEDKRAQANELLVSIALMRSLLGASEKAGVEYVYAVAESGLWAHFKKIGIPFEQVGEPEYLAEYQSYNYPLRVKISEIMDGIWKNDLAFFEDRNSEHGALITRPRKLARFFASALDGSVGVGGFGFEDFLYDERADERNLGFLSKEEQLKLRNSSVAIAGAGGDGGQLAIDLARLGIGEFRLADPEEFEIENLNRQAGSNYRTIGKNKAIAVAEEILRINPSANVRVYTDGITADNIEEFLAGSDLVLDETEFTHPELGVMIAREARKQKIANLIAFNVGFGTYATSYHPEGRKLEDQLGISDDMPLEEVQGLDLPLERWLGHLPSYADIGAFKKVAAGEVSAPSVAQGVSLAAGVAATQAMLHLLKSEKRGTPIYSPRAISYDAIDGERLIRFHRLAYYRSALKMIIRNALNKNQEVDF